VRSGLQLPSWHGAAVSTRYHSACCWSNIASSTTICGCQQHVIRRLETELMRLLDHAHGTVYLSSSLTARHFSPSRNISRLTYLVDLFRARFDCVKRLCSSLGRLRRYNFVKLHYITLHYNVMIWYRTMSCSTSSCTIAAAASPPASLISSISVINLPGSLELSSSGRDVWLCGDSISELSVDGSAVGSLCFTRSADDDPRCTSLISSIRCTVNTMSNNSNKIK